MIWLKKLEPVNAGEWKPTIQTSYGSDNESRALEYGQFRIKFKAYNDSYCKWQQVYNNNNNKSTCFAVEKINKFHEESN